MPTSGGKRAPSAFNLFMREELKRVKNLNPNLKHQDAFKTAAHNWKKGPSGQCLYAARTFRYNKPNRLIRYLPTGRRPDQKPAPPVPPAPGVG